MFNFPYKGAILSFVVFMVVFGSGGLWAAGFFCWLHFYIFVMPNSWK